MASKEHKIVRRARALSQLSMLSKLLAEHLDIEIPDVQVTNRDAELAEIQRIENINSLLEKLLQAEQPTQTAGATEKATAKKPVKHGAGK